ncbi:unnamed protein product [Caenorhabditis auriculariae]|uniref:Uncharacterized protein n=1 Tax=Caenorhabditis auriculariae TaxID=2777116 RepID=A0A8S1HIM1_9PELO|nr:unnamed protein product [Caenorhabditis auriculariae]
MWGRMAGRPDGRRAEAIEKIDEELRYRGAHPALIRTHCSRPAALRPTQSISPPTRGLLLLASRLDSQKLPSLFVSSLSLTLSQVFLSECISTPGLTLTQKRTF